MAGAVYFDFDGTLFDTRADLAAAVNDTRRDLQLAELTLPEVLRHVGHGAKYLLTHAIPERADAAAHWEEFAAHYRDHAVDQVQPYPGVVATLDELRRRGWLLAINTSKPAPAVRQILERFRLVEYFGAVVAAGDCPELKPSPLTLEYAARQLGRPLAPTDWMVGDAWMDLSCAHSAGVKAAYSAFGFGDRRDFPADAELNEFADLLKYLA